MSCIDHSCTRHMLAQYTVLHCMHNSAQQLHLSVLLHSKLLPHARCTSASYSSIAAGERDATILRQPAAAATQSGDVLDGSLSTPSISGIALCIGIAAQWVHQCEAAIVQCSH
eukprot:18530-Heterococcus_DN1.PRE.2